MIKIRLIQVSISALAGLTYWLRLQVVTYISRRRSFDNSPDLSLNLEDSFYRVMHSLDLGCWPDLGVCLSQSAFMGLREAWFQKVQRAPNRRRCLASFIFFGGGVKFD